MDRPGMFTTRASAASVLVPVTIAAAVVWGVGRGARDPGGAVVTAPSYSPRRVAPLAARKAPAVIRRVVAAGVAILPGPALAADGHAAAHLAGLICLTVIILLFVAPLFFRR